MPTTTGASAECAWFSWMTATGQCACRTSDELTDPSRLRRDRPCPRDPTTSRIASRLMSTNVGTVEPTTVCASIDCSGPAPRRG